MSVAHLEHVGNYIVEKQPDVIVNIGDFNDMVSLNSYEVGKADAEGTRYADDIAYGKHAMDKLLGPMRRYNAGRRKKYTPRMVFTMGNHEYRIEREAATNPRMIGTIGLDDLGYREAGWEVFPFLKVARIDGIDYAHFFVSGSMGRPVSSAAALLRVRQSSAIMGHVQQTDVAVHPRTGNIAVFAGTCYTHNESYLGEQANNQRRQILVCNEVRNGTFDPMLVSLSFLKRKYS